MKTCSNKTAKQLNLCDSSLKFKGNKHITFEEFLEEFNSRIWYNSSQYYTDYGYMSVEYMFDLYNKA